MFLRLPNGNSIGTDAYSDAHGKSDGHAYTSANVPLLSLYGGASHIARPLSLAFFFRARPASKLSLNVWSTSALDFPLLSRDLHDPPSNFHCLVRAYVQDIAVSGEIQEN